MYALKPTDNQTQTGFAFLLYAAFSFLFIGQAPLHIAAVLFIAWLLITRPRLPLIPAFWWLVAFTAWEWISNYAGPYPEDGIEGGGISYHFLIILLPLCISVINYSKLVTYITVGALLSTALIWAQSFIGVDLDNAPLRIDWDGGILFNRAPGFNSRPWETQFIYSMVFLSILSHLDWRKKGTWVTGFALSTGVLIPQIRAIIVAFISGLGIQLIFSDGKNSKKQLFKRLLAIVVITVVCIGTIAALRPDFFNSLSTGNGRDKIFSASIEIFNQHPTTGIGGGEHFKNEYQDAWNKLGLGKKTEQEKFLYTEIGHAHNDILLLLIHHGWPALILWFGFIIHSLAFVWKHGDRQDKALFASLIAMHHIAGLSETYLDYSNTTYTIFLCYGLALHKPVHRYLQSSQLQR